MLWANVYRVEIEIGHRWIGFCQWQSEIAEVMQEQDNARALGHNTRIIERIEQIVPDQGVGLFAA